MFISYSRLEEGFTVLSLLLYSGAFAFFIGVTNPLYLLVRLTSFSIFLITLVLIYGLRKKVVLLLKKEILLTVLVGLAICSIGWSSLPLDDAIYRGSGFCGQGVLPLIQVTLFATYFAIRYPLTDQMRLLGWMYGLAIVLSIGVAIALPHYGVMGSIATAEDARHLGSWRGVFPHKNFLGHAMVWAICVFWLLSKTYVQQRWLHYGLIALSGFLIFLSTSKGALVALLINCVLVPGYGLLKRYKGLAVPIFIWFIFAGLYATLVLTVNAEAILSALGRDLTFTGRTVIWTGVIDKIGEQFWLGYGFNSLWFSIHKGLADFWTVYGSGAPAHAHNGVLDLFLDLGFVGVLVFSVSYITSLVKAVRWAESGQSFLTLWPLMFLTLFMQFNLPESSLMREDLPWLLYVSVVLTMQMPDRNLLTSSVLSP